MRTRLVAVAMLALAGTPALAHRLDEYLQGAIVSIDKDRLQVQMTLTPGVSVFPILIAAIDSDGDGAISETEQRDYIGRVLEDLSLTIDGHRLTPQLLSLRFPTTDEMKEGRGEIQFDFNAELPRGGNRRKVVFENHHQSRISAYQVNCLIPRDPNIRIAAQVRNYSQSVYQLEYVESEALSGAPSMALLSGYGGWVAGSALVLFTGLLLVWRKKAGIPLPMLARLRRG